MDFKNARPEGQPIGRYNPLEVAPTIVSDDGVIAAQNVNGGMVSSGDPADIPDNAFFLLDNFRFLDGNKCEVRKGTSVYSAIKPNTNKVLRFYDYKSNNGNHTFLRCTKNTIHKAAGGGTWTAFTAGVGGSLTGGDSDRFRLITVFGRCFFTNNGADVIQELDPNTNTYLALGDAPRYKYMTGFYNRIVGAYRKDTNDNPVEIGWSAEAGVTGVGLNEWNPAVDQTAGNSPLIDSPTDFGDFITGIFSFSNVLMVLREQSIWLGTKVPIPTNPFSFYSAFPGIGCDCPDSARVTVNGLTWADVRTNMVWHYTPGGSPQPIGMDIQGSIFSGMSDQKDIISCYSSATFEYFLVVPQASTNEVIIWCYNFKTQKWTKLHFDGISSLDAIDLGAASLTIADLTGTIAGLTGTIAELGRSGTAVPTIVFGRTDGELLIESNTLTTDPVLGNTALALDIDTTVLSKSFVSPRTDIYVNELRIELIPFTAGQLILGFTKDDGASFSTTGKTINFVDSDLGTPKIIKWRFTARTRRYMFRVLSSGARYRLLGYELHINRAGDSRGYGVKP